MIPDKIRDRAVLIALFVAIAFGIYFGFIYNNRTKNGTQTQSYPSQKCPESYSTDEERVAEAKSFTTDFLASNPQGNITDYAQARIDFLTKNNCTQTLKYIQDNGGIEVYKKTIIDNLTATGTQATSVDFKDIPNTALSVIGSSPQDYFRDSSGINIISVSPSIGFKTGIPQYPTLTWKTQYINMKELGASIDIQYPQFKSGNAITDLDLNQYVSTIVTERIKYDRNLLKNWSTDDVDLYAEGLDLAIRYRVIGVVNGIVSIEMVVTDFTGGGAGNHDTPYTINWDLKSDRLLNPSDIFCSTDYINILMPLARKQLTEDFENDPYITVHPIPDSYISWINSGTENDPNNWQHFLLNKNGVIAVFPPYQVSDGGSGIVRTFIQDSKSLNLLCLP